MTKMIESDMQKELANSLGLKELAETRRNRIAELERFEGLSEMFNRIVAQTHD